MGFDGIYHFLVGGIPTSLKHIKVNWNDEIPNNGKRTNVPQHQPDFHGKHANY